MRELTRERKALVCSALRTYSGAVFVPSSHAGPVVVLRPPVAYLSCRTPQIPFGLPVILLPVLLEELLLLLFKLFIIDKKRFNCSSERPEFFKYETISASVSKIFLTAIIALP